MDVDVYSDDGSTKIDVKGMKVNIEIILGRMKAKNPPMVTMTREFLFLLIPVFPNLKKIVNMTTLDIID